jgi:hypothetical protein
MESSLHHLKRAAVSYAGVAVPLALMPGTGLTWPTVIAGLGVVGIGYGYFILVRQLF